MKLDEFIAYLKADLEPWTTAQKGAFHVARDPLHPYVILAGGAFATFVVILNFTGGAALNTDVHPHGLADARVEIFIGHTMDLRKDPGAWLFQNTSEHDSLLKQLSLLQAQVFTIVFDNGENCDPAYCQNDGTEPATLFDGTPLRAFKLAVSWPLPIELDAANYRFLNAPAGHAIEANPPTKETET